MSSQLRHGGVLVSIRGTLLRSALSCFAVASMWFSAAAAAAGSSTVTVVHPGPPERKLEVGVTPDGRAVFGESVFFIVSVRNAGTSPVTLRQVALKPVGLLGNVYSQFDCKAKFGNRLLAATQTVSVVCELKAGRVPLVVFLNREGQYRLVADVMIAALDDPIPSSPLSVKLDMPEIAVVYGALVGSILLVMFSTAYSYLRSLPEVPSDMSALKSQVTSFLLRFPIRLVLAMVEMTLRTVQGAVVAIILIVMTRTTTDIGAPIAVRVDDFWGGLVVGIFSVPLANWLADKLALATATRAKGAGRPDGQGADTPPSA